MNSRRARNQYGKVSKRVNDRANSGTRVDVSDDQSDDQVELVLPEVKGVSRRTSSKRNLKINSDKVTQNPVAPTGKLAPATRSRQGSEKDERPPSPKKRKRRESSPADSETTETAEEEEPTPRKPKQRSPERSPARKIQATESGKFTPVPKSASAVGTPSQPAQTPRLARDLSDLFISPHKPNMTSATGSPPKLKRMLSSRSKTEPTLQTDSLATGSDLFHSTSMFNPPTQDPLNSPIRGGSSFNRNPLARDRTPSPSPQRNHSPPPISRSPQRPGRTYSKSRSFLIEVSRDETQMDVDAQPARASHTQNEQDPSETHRESYSELRSRWGLDNSEQDPELNMPVNDLNSIGEMRSRGETRRFLDELGYLFDGLDTTSGSNTSAKRSSAIQVVSKMGDAEFLRRAAAADFVGKAWTLLRAAGAGTGTDRILDASLIAFVAIATRDQRQTTELAKNKDFISFLNASLEVTPEEDVLVAPETKEEPLWARRLGLSRVDKTSLTVLRGAIKDGRILSEGEVASHRLLASESLVKVAAAGQKLDQELGATLCRSLSIDLSILTAEDLQDADSDQQKHHIHHILNCLKVLEHVGLSEEDQGYESLVASLGRFVNSWTSYLHNSNEPALFNEMVESTLRRLITATHDRKELCKAIAEEENVFYTLLRLFIYWNRAYFNNLRQNATKDAEDHDRSGLLQRASLVLGLLTQILRQHHEAKGLLRSMRLSIACPLGANCYETCRCKKQVSGLQALGSLFKQPADGLTAPAEAQATFIHGHIGVLLGMIYIHDVESRPTVLDCLDPPKGSSKEKVTTLISVIREFCSLLATVVSKANPPRRASSTSSDADEEQPTETIIADASLDEGVQLAESIIKELEQLL